MSSHNSWIAFSIAFFSPISALSLADKTEAEGRPVTANPLRVVKTAQRRICPLGDICFTISVCLMLSSRFCKVICGALMFAFVVVRPTGAARYR